MRLWALVAAATLLIAFNAGAQAQQVVFNTQDFPPFTYLQGDVPAGPGVDLLKAVCTEAGVRCKVQLLPWTRAQQEVKAGKAQGLFLIGWNKERAEWLNFSPPVINTEYGVFVNTNSSLVYSSPEQLKGCVVGAYGPSNTSTSLEELKKNGADITIDLTPDEPSVFKKLGSDRIKAGYSNRDVGMALISKLGLTNIRYAGADKKLQYYYGFSKLVDKTVVDRFATAYKKLYANGVVQKLLGSLEAAKPE